MNRADLNQLSDLRIREATALFSKRYYDGACYLAGFSIECALKACIARKTAKHSFPNRDVVLKSWTHDLRTLVDAAGLKKKIDVEIGRNKALGKNWWIVLNWSVERRYVIVKRRMARKEADDLLQAISDPVDGVLAWLKQFS